MSKELGATAASPSAPESQPAAEAPSFAARQSKWTPEQLADWQLTGKEPESPAPDTKEGEPPATTSADAASKPAPESGPEKKTEEPREDTHRRLSRRDRKIGELSAENRRLQRELEALRAGTQPNADPGKPAEAPKPLQRPKRPRIGDFDTTDAYDAAMDQYETQLDAFLDQQHGQKLTAAERQREERQSQRESEEEFADIQKGWHKQCAEYRKTHQDFDQSFQTVSKATQAAGAGHIDQFILESDFGTALIDHLAKHPDAFAELLELSPVRGIAQLGVLERQFAKAPIPKKTSSAPEPPEAIGGASDRSEGPKPGSAAWIEAENARDLRRLGIGA